MVCKFVKHELPLGAAVSYGQSCFLKLWNQSFNFNEADAYLVLIINPLFNRKKGKKNAASDQYETSKLKMFVFSFSVCVNHVVFCVFVKSSSKFPIGWTATWYRWNTSMPFVALFQWKYTSNRWMYLRHCVPSLLRFRVRNSGVQDNVYVIVPIIFGPVAQLYISHIQEQNNFIKTKPRNIFCLFFRENWQYLNPLVPSIKRKSPALIFGPVRFNNTISSFKGSIINVSCLLAVVR